MPLPVVDATWSSKLSSKLSLRLSRLRGIRYQPSASIFLQLPVELYLEILEYLQTADVLAVLETCQATKVIAEAYLYKHITVLAHNRRRLSCLLRTLSTRPDLAQRVHTWNGYLYPVLYKAPYPDAYGPKLLSKQRLKRRRQVQEVVDFSSTLAKSLNHMSNLKSMTIRDFDWLWTASHSVVAPSVAGASLTALFITGSAFRCPGRRAGYELELAMILKSQPLLERLELRSGKWDMEEWLTPKDLTHLHTLVAGEADARRLIPGRPITSLTLHYVTRVLDNNAWQGLAASSEPITSLTFSVSRKEFIPPILQSAAKHMEALESICASSLCIEHLGKVYENFPTFKRLRYLSVTMRECWHNDTKLKEEYLTDLRTGVQMGSPSIEHVRLGPALYI
ncbi:hypothetical protein FRB97_008650 [Tulasnella sp. 331]|nr:hypothetical protein FRB97_008650 [Tulasnella sp. 331]